MSLSASRLGDQYGLTAQEMNMLLKEQGYLAGEPGNYSPTLKGKQFVYEKGDDNGYGGYARRGWNWLEWDERIMDELHVTAEVKQEIKEKTAIQRRNKRAQQKADAEEYWKNLNANKQSTTQNSESNDIGGFWGLLFQGVKRLFK
mgnify:CR=1 FL=1